MILVLNALNKISTTGMIQLKDAITETEKMATKTSLAPTTVMLTSYLLKSLNDVKRRKCVFIVEKGTIFPRTVFRESRRKKKKTANFLPQPTQKTRRLSRKLRADCAPNQGEFFNKISCHHSQFNPKGGNPCEKRPHSHCN